MNKQIVLNLSNISGKLRAFVAEQVKKNLVALGFNVGDSDHSHLGFSLNADGGKLNINFNFNNPNQATAHLTAGASIFNEHQLAEFFAAAKELALSARAAGVTADNEPDRIVKLTIDGFSVEMCKHGFTVQGKLAQHFALALDAARYDKFINDVIAAGKKNGLIPEHVNDAFPLGLVKC